jgi:replicative DNA helicase
MKNDERLSGALQENILVLLCFDDAHCKIARASLTPQLFESSVFREVAGHAIDFIDQYGEAIKDHLPDHLEDILKGDDARKAKSYQVLLENLYQSRESVNPAYVISQLHKFVRLQTFKSALVRAVEAVEDGRIDAAEVEMQKGMANQAMAFEPGLSLHDPDAIGTILDEPEEEGFNLGIPDLDRLGIKPRRKELFIALAPRKRGKSWFITHCAKQALLQRWSCVIITLEMSEKRYAARMLQSFFSISRREAMVKVTRFVRGKDGELEGMIQEQIERTTMQDEGIRASLTKKANREFKRRKQLKIKSFPTGTLTIAALEAYLDGLERFEGFVPDAICIDYPALMELDVNNLRLALGKAMVDIRGIGGKRNAAMIVVHQGNRISEDATTVTGSMASEDISILATADNLITLNQTPAEKKLGLMRVLADATRNEESKAQVLMTQAYGIGQFCLDSVLLNSDYWELLDSKEGEGERRQARRDHDDDDDAPRRRTRARD